MTTSLLLSIALLLLIVSIASLLLLAFSWIFGGAVL